MDSKAPGGVCRLVGWASLTALALVVLPAAAAVAGAVPPDGTAVDDALTVKQDSNAGLDVTANDVINGGFVLQTGRDPAHGRLEGRTGSPGWYQYFPNAGFSGTDSFTYSLSFDDESSSIGTVSITVVATPKPTTTTTTRRTTTTTTTRRTAAPTATTTRRAATTTTTRARRTTTTTVPITTTTSAAVTGPQASDDTSSSDFGAPVVIPVLSNDHGALVPGTVTVTTAPQHGTAAVNPDGTVTYTSTSDTTAFTDTFRYQVADSAGATAQAAVTVRLDEPDDLLLGKTFSAPGGTLQVGGHGCRGQDSVQIQLNGAAAGQAQAGSEGGFQLKVLAPDTIGRYRLSAVCTGHALQSWLDVVQTTSADGGGSAAAAAGIIGAAGAILTFYLLTGFLLAAPTSRSRLPLVLDLPLEDEVELRGLNYS